MGEPLSPVECRATVRVLLGVAGAIRFSGHAKEEMAKDEMVVQDVENVLRAGSYSPGEWEYGSWRYRVSTQRMAVVIAFASESILIVVTAWRRNQ